MKRMEERLRKVLFSVTREYIKTRRPVSSRRVLDVTNMDWSGATIRNDMKKLEEMGYLYQPHTSAGRIPTDKALRFYLDEILKMRRTWRDENLGIDLSPNFPIGDLSTILDALARIVSRAVSGLVVMTRPRFSDLRIMGVHLTPITKDFAVVSAVTELGLSSVVPMRSSGMDLKSLERLFGLFSGRTFSEVFKILKDLEIEDETLKEAMKTVKNVLKLMTLGEGPIVRGIAELLKEFQGRELEGLIRVIENQEKIEEIAKKADEGLRVFIGSENDIEALRPFSLFVAPYRKSSLRIGSVILITSKYVVYERIYPLIEFVSNRLTEYLTVTSREVM